MFTQGPPDAGEGPYPNLLLKIGGAILESESQKGLITVHLTLNELWMIREVAKSSVVVGSERVGLNLLLKIYGGLRVLSASAEITDFENQIRKGGDFGGDTAIRSDSDSAGHDAATAA